MLNIFEDVPLVEFMYLVFTRMPGESYRRRLMTLLLYLCCVFRALINSQLCWFIKIPVSESFLLSIGTRTTYLTPTLTLISISVDIEVKAERWLRGQPVNREENCRFESRTGLYDQKHASHPSPSLSPKMINTCIYNLCFRCALLWTSTLWLSSV